MFWQKESKSKNALYVDIFNSGLGLELLNTFYRNITSEVTHSILDKSDAIALRKRKEGNTYFGRHKWSEAMELYNECLCYAKPGSEHISLAYANRSACFFNMKMYKKCLIDIESAKQTGYPDHLMPKLNRRNDECLRLTREGAEAIGVDFSLSFEPHEKFPVMANMLQFERDDDNSISIVANENIDIGKTVMVDKAFIALGYKRGGWRCNICLAKHGNLIACNICTTAMFCEECQSNNFHKDECGLKVSEVCVMNGAIMTEVRNILKVVTLFASVDELMDFVERTMESDFNEMPGNFYRTKVVHLNVGLCNAFIHFKHAIDCFTHWNNMKFI